MKAEIVVAEFVESVKSVQPWKGLGDFDKGELERHTQLAIARARERTGPEIDPKLVLQAQTYGSQARDLLLHGAHGEAHGALASCLEALAEALDQGSCKHCGLEPSRRALHMSITQRGLQEKSRWLGFAQWLFDTGTVRPWRRALREAEDTDRAVRRALGA